MGVSVSPFFGSHLHGKYQNDPSSYSKMSLVKELHNLIAESILSHNLLKHSHLLVSQKEESYLITNFIETSTPIHKVFLKLAVLEIL